MVSKIKVDEIESSQSGGSIAYNSSMKLKQYTTAQISPHNAEGEWTYYSENSITGKRFKVNMEKMIRKLEEITGENFIEIDE